MPSDYKYWVVNERLYWVFFNWDSNWTCQSWPVIVVSYILFSIKSWQVIPPYFQHQHIINFSQLIMLNYPIPHILFYIYFVITLPFPFIYFFFVIISSSSSISTVGKLLLLFLLFIICVQVMTFWYNHS